MTTELKDGIYFDLDEAIYHALPRLSVSGMQKLLVSPATFWAGSWLNPKMLERDEEATKAQLLGRAYHTARLEPEKLESRFVRALEKEDMPEGTLFTGTDMGLALASLGEPKTKAGESVLDQARRLQAAYDALPVPPEPPALWHLALAEWEEARQGRVPIPAKYWEEIQSDMELIRSTPEIARLLNGGYAEVSILWTDEKGIHMKARVDYLRADGWCDFKSFANPMGKHLEQCIEDAFTYNRYHIQAAGYRDAIAAAFAPEGLRVHGSKDEWQFIEDVREHVANGIELVCHYVFQEKGIPNLLGKEIEFFDIPITTQLNNAGASIEAQERVNRATRTEQLWFQRAKREIRKAKRLFAAYSDVFEPGHPWRPFNVLGKLNDMSFRTNWLDQEIGD